MPEPIVASEPEPEPVVVAPEPAEPQDVHIVGDHLTIDRHISFASASNEILAECNDLLDHVAQLVNLHAEIQHISIIGHTDGQGSAAANMTLSASRAEAVVEALRTRGVNIELEASGAGETQTLCQEDTDECHAQNRRVEFLIVSDASSDAHNEAAH